MQPSNQVIPITHGLSNASVVWSIHDLLQEKVLNHSMIFECHAMYKMALQH